MSSLSKATIISASAGSGKTFTLTLNYLCRVLGAEPQQGRFDPFSFRRILAVTFTNKATEEMKRRIIEELHILASHKTSEYLDKIEQITSLTEPQIRKRAEMVQKAILHDYSRFTVLTNDKFFQRVLRAFIRELGMSLGYTVELDSTTLTERGADALLEASASDEKLRIALSETISDNIEEEASWDVRKTILKLRKELYKDESFASITQTDPDGLKGVISRLKSLIEKSKNTNIKAVQPLLEKAEMAGLTSDEGPLNKNALKVVRNIAISGFSNLSQATPKKILLSDDYTCLVKSKKSVSEEERELLEHLFQATKQALEHNLDQERTTYELLKRTFRSFTLLHELYLKCKELEQEDNTIQLSETKQIIARFINDTEAPFIYEKIGNTFDAYMIDEFQDTATREWKNFLPLLREAISRCEESAVLLVGDIKQSIYRWRGGDWNILQSQAAQDLGNGDDSVEQIPLTDNYRSLQNIVEFNNDCMQKVAQCGNQRINSILEDGLKSGALSEQEYNVLYNAVENVYKDLRQTPKKRDSRGGYIEITEYSDEHPSDPCSIIRRMLEQGYKPCDIAILVRNNKDAFPVARQILTSDWSENGYPEGLNVVTQDALQLSASRAIKGIIACLRLAIQPSDAVSMGIFKKDVLHISLSEQAPEADLEFIQSLASYTPAEAFERIIARYPGLPAESIAHTQTLHDHVLNFCSGKVSDIDSLLKWWDEKEEKEEKLSVIAENNGNAIKILTIHKAKGLENKVIIMPKCDWSVVPKSSGTVWADANESHRNELPKYPIPFQAAMGNSWFSDRYYTEVTYSLIDSINMLYVALTRAKENLFICIPQSSDKNSVASILKSILGEDGTLLRCKPESISSQENGLRTFRYGVPTCAKKDDDKEKENKDKEQLKKHIPVRIEDYSSHPHNGMLKLKFTTDRYFEKGDRIEISPRNKGIMLHSVLENARSEKDIDLGIEELAKDGILSRSECLELRSSIEKSFMDEQIRSWFSGDWKQIFTEKNILMPEDIDSFWPEEFKHHDLSKKTIQRPDRVMVKNEETLLVDYKFGEENKSHHFQLRAYMYLLEKMGYKNLSAYIWHIRKSKKVKVERNG